MPLNKEAMRDHLPGSLTQEPLKSKDGYPWRVLSQNFVFCTAIAIVLWQFVPAVGQYGFISNFVHAQAIGNSITLLAIAFSRWLNASGYCNSWYGFLSIAMATCLGTVSGVWLAGALLGLPGGPLMSLYHADHLLVTAVTAVLASLAFNWHLNRREKLIRLELTASEQRRRADNAHHAMLRAQLDPHMLFNTLANLRALIGQDTVQALDMLDRLDSFLRETLKSSRSTHHTLSQELKVLEDYLALMKVRMGERLSYSFSIAPSSSSTYIPALILQPLVENAIRHGIDPLLDGGQIEISARQENQSLYLSVVDNGVGMKTNDSDPATHADPANESSGFGLDNLRQRLQQNYGDKASFSVTRALLSDDAEHPGTRVTIQLPTLPDNNTGIRNVSHHEHE